MSDALPDRIEIRGIRADGIHGVLPQEQAHAQPFEVDLDISADLWDAGVSDSLADTIDYGYVIERTVQVIESERHDLLERIAERIADEVLACAGVIEVTVTVRKLRVPVDAQVGSAGIRITRS